MAEFVYKARKGPQELLEGILRGDSESAVVERLRGLGYFPLSVTRLETAAQRNTKARTPGKVRFEAQIRSKDVAYFTRQLADLLESGMTVHKALLLLGQELNHAHFQKVIGQIAEAVRNGTSLSDAFKEQPKLFSPLYVSMVHVGEVGGTLQEVLTRLADFKEKEREIKGKVISAMAYPAFMALVGAVTVVILMILVVPSLAEMFSDLGQTLPLPTRMLIFVSEAFRHYFWLPAVAAGMLLLVVRGRKRNLFLNRMLSTLAMKVPLIGSLVRRYEIGLFSRTLATLLQSGVSILPALEVVAPTTGNALMQRDIEDLQTAVREGGGIGTTLRKSRVFRGIVASKIAVGEESNQLERVLNQIADSFEREIDRELKVLTALLEPMLILMVGSVIGFIVFSILLPIFDINLVN